MKSYLTQTNKKISNSSNSNCKNKQNINYLFKGQKDICKILSHFNDLIQSNNQAISSLRNEFTNRATNGSFSKNDITQCFNVEQQRSYCQGPDNSMNQTQLTFSKQPNSIQYSQGQFNRLNVLNQKLEQIQHQIQVMKNNDTQNSFNLEKRFSEKGEKTQIQKVLNLSRLLVVEINQIQDRFKENQKITRIHEDKIKFLQQTQNKMDQRFTSQTKLRSNSMNEQKSEQKDSLLHQNSILNETFMKNIDNKIQQISKSNHLQIQQFTQQIQDNCSKKYQEQLNQIYSRIVNLESSQEQVSTKNQTLSTEIKLELHNLTQENKKQSQKIKKDTQFQLYKKFDSLDKLYTKKSSFLKEKEQNQTEMQKIAQNLNKVQYQFISRMQKIQKSHQSMQIIIQNHNNTLFDRLNKLSEDHSDKLTQTIQQIEKTLTKYVKTQAMKHLFEQQNQKINQIINSNLEEQKQVNEVLCSQNILGRWLWQNQELKGGNLVSWDQEVINTLPQNFRFTLQKSTVIEISNGGIYKFELGFYSKKKPTIQILINGKVVISAVNSSSYVIHHSSGKLKSIEATEMSGLTLVDFFLIPEHSRIAIAYSGDVNGEGFLNIHRM